MTICKIARLDRDDRIFCASKNNLRRHPGERIDLGEPLGDASSGELQGDLRPPVLKPIAGAQLRVFEPAVQDHAAVERVMGSANHSHAVWDPGIEDGQLVEEGWDPLNDVDGLQIATGIELAPEIQGLATKQLRLAAAEPAR